MSPEIPARVLRDAAGALRHLPLDAPGDASGGVPALEPETRHWLDRLGYLALGGPATAPRLRWTAGDRANRAALMAVAANLRRLFVLPAPDAPGAVFVGAEVDPGAFGLPAPNGRAVGVSGLSTTLAGAFERCVGEAAEYLSMLRRGDEAVRHGGGAEAPEVDGVEPPDPEMAAWMRVGLGLEEGVPGGLEWLVADRLDGGGRILVPADLCLRRVRPAGDPVRRETDSNGHAVGADAATACRHALLEVVERDAVALWWFGRRTADALAPDIAERAGFDGLLAGLRAGHAGRRTRLLDVTADPGIPVVVALSSDAGGRAVVAGAAARPDPADAVRSAVLEMCQMEVAQRLVFLKRNQRGVDALNAQDRHVLERATALCVETDRALRGADTRRRPPTRAVDDDGDVHALADRLARAGFTALLYRPAPVSAALPAARVVVPGLQSMKPDWVSPRLRDAARSAGVDPLQLGMDVSIY